LVEPAHKFSTRPATPARRISLAICSVEAALAALQLEPLLGFELGKNVMCRGGYNSREQFVRDVTSRLEIEYAKHYGLTRARQRAG
jgi:hypothetical protein